MTVTGTNAGTPSLTITTPTANIIYQEGDIIAKINYEATVYPGTIQYAQSAAAVGTTCSGNCLTRVVNGTTNVVANNITDLQFGYILDNGTETGAPDLSQIRAVRVTITGETVATTALSGGQAKTRQIASILRIRNR